MVLQRTPHRAIIWGYASENSIISLNLFDKNYTTIASKSKSNDSSAMWKLILDPIDYKYPLNLEIIELDDESKNLKDKVVLNNVLFGDIWLCSGQSNMEITLLFDINGQEEIDNSDKYKNIRLFTVGYSASNKPQDDISRARQNWSIPSRESLAASKWSFFSAVCWYFGKKLSEKIDYPIGLLADSKGGTEIERWVSEDVLKACNVKNRNFNDSTLWNSMIHPMLKFPIYGVIWYQGEYNTDYNADLYSCNFEGLVKSWRNGWYESTDKSTNPNFPFGFVQIANIDLNETSVGSWPWLRWYQTSNFGYSPNEKLNNVFMTTAIDLVDNTDDAIHPRFKKDIGSRLGLGAFNLAYNMKDVEYAPPICKSVKYLNKKIEVLFESEFKPIEFNVLNQKGFDVCCDSDKCLINDYDNWHIIDNFELINDKIFINKPSKCNKVEYIRYLWRQKPCEFKSCSLYSKMSNLPVYPFLRKVQINNNSSHKLNSSNLFLLFYQVLSIFLLKLIN